MAESASGEALPDGELAASHLALRVTGAVDRVGLHRVGAARERAVEQQQVLDAAAAAPAELPGAHKAAVGIAHTDGHPRLVAPRILDPVLEHRGGVEHLLLFHCTL